MRVTSSRAMTRQRLCERRCSSTAGSSSTPASRKTCLSRSAGWSGIRRLRTTCRRRKSSDGWTAMDRSSVLPIRSAPTEPTEPTQPQLGYSGVMACRSLLLRILEAARKERLIATNPVREVDAPEPPVNPDEIFGNVRRRTFTPEEFGELLAACRPFYRDHFLTQASTGLRPGELLGLRRRRVQLERRRIEVLEVRYEAGKFGRGFKDRPKNPASIRVVPMAEAVRGAIVRQLPPGSDPEDLVFTGPGGNRWAKRGARPPLSTHNYRRVYKAAIVKMVKAPDGTITEQPRFPHLDLHGPHDLRRTFATWLEDAGIPSRVIDELMGHVGTKRERAQGASPMGRVYRETTKAMAARATEVLDERLALARKVASGLLRSGQE